MGRGSSKAGNGGNAAKISHGETVFAAFPPNSLHPNGDAIIAKTSDDRYRYLGFVPNYDSIQIDKNSSNYRRAERDFNIKAKITANGEVVVSAAGLYQRKKTYKSVNDFKKDAMKRVNSRSEYNDAELRALKDGYVSQIQAENWKSLLTKKTQSDALKQMQKDIKEDMKYLKERQKAADVARAKIKRIGGN